MSLLLGEWTPKPLHLVRLSFRFNTEEVLYLHSSLFTDIPEISLPSAIYLWWYLEVWQSLQFPQSIKQWARIRLPWFMPRHLSLKCLWKRAIAKFNFRKWLMLDALDKWRAACRCRFGGWRALLKGLRTARFAENRKRAAGKLGFKAPFYFWLLRMSPEFRRISPELICRLSRLFSIVCDYLRHLLQLNSFYNR